MARVTYNGARLKAYTASLPKRADVIAEKVARRLEGQIKENIQAVGAVDTGALLNSPTVTPAGEGARDVTVGAAHGAFVNYGTYKMPARPFFEPAILSVQQEVAGLARIELQP